ncbi:NADH-quinone oxidoreductase subunit 12 [bacterium BMS3Abin07]|nr:NADH-quinone oxidoreductase subunit 12 [bacterium BMS3Abin07]GBE32464.1 NADH-quinone oxidoreductase subunit 12 [bacterium BMS3Bbin05]HDL20999.1 NADH-quinone oxidoreductase subunit L [Nitrospirota bacterium]HDO22958.1 NADH-quinone oxidoreductase subunit L [Nitrospirota bacterium]HDZ87942.1 NADH-quinone oxidoreductase subunit L [Nitrospirota bacterium]
MKYYLLIPFLPLAAFVINILLGRKILKTASQWVSILAVFGSMVISYMTVFDVIRGHTLNADLYTWIIAGTGFRVSVGFLIDQLTAVMLVVVTTVSFLVHVYSVGYMRGDKGYYRFFAYLSLFTFSMLMLIMANNMLQLYFGWEAVGLCSYLLIGFWYEKKSASDAGKKAFIVNRFGDFGFGLGVILVFLTFGTLHYLPVFDKVASVAGQTISIFGMEVNLVTVIALLLFCGAVGKSAQFPLHVWLPDAMEGPTPVSALIHAATMVTAGVFMLARLNPIFNVSPVAMDVIAITGGFTALFAATIALVQNDIKRVIAYSTVSQLGYMVLACGVGAYGAGIFHLYTHAFFKALLFLCAGSVMHAMAGELDMQKMGGLRKYMPVTYWTMLLASLSISGIPPFAGFFSKDEILWLAFNGNGVGKFVWLLGTVAALLTAFYSFRLIYLTFHGEFRGTEEQRHHLHESPKVMTIPLVLLCIGAVASGWIGIPELIGGEHSNWIANFVRPVVGHPEVNAAHSTAWMVIALSVAIALTGIFVARSFYIKNKELPGKFAGMFPFTYRVLFNKYYVDELYDLIIVRAAKGIARNIMVGFTDSKIIEGIVNGIPRLIGWTSAQIRKVQSGDAHRYAAMMVLGMFLIFALMLVKLLG